LASSMMSAVKASSSSHPLAGSRWVVRRWPRATQARRSDTFSSASTLSTQARLGVGSEVSPGRTVAYFLDKLDFTSLVPPPVEPVALVLISDQPSAPLDPSPPPCNQAPVTPPSSAASRKPITPAEAIDFQIDWRTARSRAATATPAWWGAAPPAKKVNHEMAPERFS
jgi:hypothetical protein